MARSLVVLATAFVNGPPRNRIERALVAPALPAHQGKPAYDLLTDILDEGREKANESGDLNVVNHS